jgi:hypothetical protein
VQINGALLEESAPIGTGSGGPVYHTLFLGESLWTPAQPGTYLIQVSSKAGGDPFSAPAFAEVTVLGDFELKAVTPPAIISLTPTPGLPVYPPPPTPTPFPTPTDTPTPTPQSVDEGVQDPSFSSDAFYYRGACGTKEMTIEVNVNDPNTYSVVLFYRLKSVDTGETTDWSNVPMAPLGGGYFGRTLHSELDIPDFNRFLRSFLQVQIVATRQNGSEIGRTGVISEVMHVHCAVAP